MIHFSPHFSTYELVCRCGRPDCEQRGMHEDFMTRLELLRAELGMPLVLNSAYRCPTHNAAVSTTGRNGPHTTGRAVDIAISGKPVVALLAAALSLGFTGIGLKQDGAAMAGRFVHLDDLTAPAYPRPRVWTY